MVCVTVSIDRWEAQTDSRLMHLHRRLNIPSIIALDIHVYSIHTANSVDSGGRNFQVHATALCSYVGVSVT